MNAYCHVCKKEMEIMQDLISEISVFPCGCANTDLQALTARADQAEAERDAWKKFALHQVTCASCADNVYSCDDAIPMMVAIRKIDHSTKEFLDSEELVEAIEKDKQKGGKA